MPQSTTKLPVIQARRRADPEGGVALPQIVKLPTEQAEKPRKKPVMRQFELIERVRRYNPNTNEALLDRAYVYAMKAMAARPGPRAIPISPTRSRSLPSSPT